MLEKFNTMIDKCLGIEKRDSKKAVNETHDIDVLFSNDEGSMFYLEVEYNDDHDTAKYANINSKFIKTYIGICNVVKVYDRNKFKPILYYLTQKKLKGNIYVPEQANIYRVNRLFKEFFTISYKDLDSLMGNIGEATDIIQLFDDLHNTVRFKLKL